MLQCRTSMAASLRSVPWGATARALSSAPPNTSGKAVSEVGKVYMWGKVDDNRMGMSLAGFNFGTQAVALGPAIPPTQHPLLPPVSQVVCRASKTLALAVDGSVYSWGSCRNLSLGHGPGADVITRPKKIEALAGIKIVAIAGGETSSAALSDEGEVYTWGWGGSWWEGNGGLGHGDKLTQPRPALVEKLVEGGYKITQISIGNGHMYALTDKGLALSWGNGEYGRCGNGKTEQLVPEPIDLLADKKVVQIVAGQLHGLALTATGDVWAWGKNDAGQLGVGGSVLMDLNTMEEFPLLVDLEGDDHARFAGSVVSIAAGGNHSLALTRDGTVFQWGQRTFLQPSPVEYGYLKPSADDGDLNIDKDKNSGLRLRGIGIAAGDGVSAVIHENGDLFTWGKNLNTGMLGHTLYGTGTRRPARVEALHGLPLSCVSFGSRHAAAVVGRIQPRAQLK